MLEKNVTWSCGYVSKRNLQTMNRYMLKYSGAGCCRCQGHSCGTLQSVIQNFPVQAWRKIRRLREYRHPFL